MTDVLVDTLRLRGPRAHRLARVAARSLPAALERALADVPDQRVDRVAVVLDLDPEEYDDETLAVLWADLVRAELVARPPSPAAGPGGWSSVAEPAPARPEAADLAAVARAWLAATGDAPLPAALLGVGDPGAAALVAGALGPAAWARLLRAVAAALRLDADPAIRPAPARQDVPEGHVDGREPAARDDPWRPAGRESRVPPAGPGSPPAAGDRDGRAPGVPPSPAGGAGPAGDVLGMLRELAGLQPDAATALDPATVTRCAGLVLLYPWLADHCRRAEELHPALDPVPVREAALAAVLGDPRHADDPLVGLLAGRAEPVDRRPVPRAPLLRADEVADSADRVLASFTALLPGFERSTPGFVRDGWLLRPGVLDADRDPRLLTAATRPLDVVLPLLPYPLGLLKLPWSPPLSVRFRP